MKVLLINSSTGVLFFTTAKYVSSTGSSFIPPLGLLYVAKALEDAGHTVTIIDIYNEKEPQKVIQKSLSSVDVVGLNVFTKNYHTATETAQMIKATDPHLPIVLGGPHCTFHPETALHDVVAADISVEGEGEHIIAEIMHAIQGTRPLSDIPGITFRQDGEIKKGPPATVIHHLDALSFPARHLVEKYQYGRVGNASLYKPKFTAMITSRGCPFRCRFCTRHITTIKTYRQRSADSVLQELQEIKDHYRSVLIVDDNFLADTKRAHAIFDGIITAGIDIEISIEGARVDTAEPDLYKKMKKGGVKQISYGIETGNQDVLDFYHKNITLDQIRSALALARKMRFQTLGTFIFGAPIETRDHIENTIKFACSLPLDLALFGPLAYQYGSDLWNEAISCGKICEGAGYSIIADSRRGLGNFTVEELEGLCKQAFRRFYLRPRYVLREVYLSLLRRNASLLNVGWDIFRSL